MRMPICSFGSGVAFFFAFGAAPSPSGGSSGLVACRGDGREVVDDGVLLD